MTRALVAAAAVLLLAALPAAAQAPAPPANAPAVPPLPPPPAATTTMPPAAAPTAPAAATPTAPGGADAKVPPADTSLPADALPSQDGVVAVLQGLDKTTARVSKFDAPVGKSVRFGTLVITARACVKHPPEEEPESAAFLQIDEVRQGDRNSVVSQRVFSGWMFASSPALSALENPIYDIGVLDCKMATAAAPSSGSTAK
jgi:hypothetical protein